MKEDLIFLATSYTDQSRTVLDKYLDGYATVQFSPEGGVEVGYDEKWYCLTGGPWFWPAHPGVRTRFRAAPGYEQWKHRHVGFRGPLAEAWRSSGLWIEEPQMAPPPRTATEWDEVFGELRELSTRSDALGRLRAINLLENLLLELADARLKKQRGAALEHTSRRAPWLECVLKELAMNPHQNNPLPDYFRLAQDLGISEATLRRGFKAAMGVSPHAYWLRLRVDAARVLLAETNLPLKAIASRLGYDNEYFFSRQFRQIAGVPPGVYRKSRLEESLT
jgi:AraC-like DNA-binding protein